MGLAHKFHRWLDHKFKNDIYELRDGEIIRWQGGRDTDRIKVESLVSWQIHPEMIFDQVVLRTNDGMEAVWLDTYNDLIAILRTVASGKEVIEAI